MSAGADPDVCLPLDRVKIFGMRIVHSSSQCGRTASVNAKNLFNLKIVR